MYKLLLCWRYLCTRYIALASIISVTLGVAVMIVVNSVMSGFASEMQNRIHGILSDVILESRSLEGVRDAEWHEQQIRKIAGDQIEGMTPTVVVPAMLSFQYGGNWITRQVQLIGIDAATQSDASDFSKYLQYPENRRTRSNDLFKLRDGVCDLRDHNGGAEMPERTQMRESGWKYRRAMAQYQRDQREWSQRNAPRARRGAGRSFCRHEGEGRGRLRPGQGTTHRRDPGHCHGQFSLQEWRRQFPGSAGRQREADLSHRRCPAQGRQRQLHRRRFLRKQDERVRRHVRVRADPQVAGAAGHDRPHHRRRP